jgi:pyruvate,water dikinase
VPMDLEWAKDGESGKLFILQARPETIHAQNTGGELEIFRLTERGRPLCSGKSVGTRIGSGPVR